MKTVDFLKLAIKSLLVNKLRTFLTMLGIIIGVGSVIMLMSVGAGVQTFVNQQFELIGSNNLFIIPGQMGEAMMMGMGGRGNDSISNQTTSQGGALTTMSTSKLKEKHVKGIKRLSSDILEATGTIELPAKATYKNEAIFASLSGIDENFFSASNLAVEVGRPIEAKDVLNKRKVAVIGPEVSEKLFPGIDPLGKKIMVANVSFEVVGITEKRGTGGIGGNIDRVIYVPFPVVQSLTEKEGLQAILVKVSDREKIPEVINLIKNYLSSELDEDEFSVIDQTKILETVNAILTILTYALTAIAAISLLVGGVGIMNIMFVSVIERTREIGIRKAVGATPGNIRSQFLTEAVILSLLGGILGVGFGVLGAKIAQRWLTTTVTPSSVILSLGVCSLIGIIFGVAPAARAAKLDPVEALRYE
ncbi:ABC transporter permease [Candidatus Shapirobacteria bacterium]|nr:ABC transporter permease [Candidatus Shapirobacteria bacterium]